MRARDVLPAARFDIAEFAALLAEPSRVAMVLSLMDGTARPATELARAAQISAQTASAHFGKLSRAGVLAVEAQGRHRYYRIANDGVAYAIEAMALVGPAVPALRAEDADRRALRFARTCYRHLAGRLGVQLAEKLERDQSILRRDGQFSVTLAGRERLKGLLGYASASLTGKACLDWTERRSHIGGTLGVLLATAFIDRCWLRRSRDGRTVRLTAKGQEGLRSTFDLVVAGP